VRNLSSRRFPYFSFNDQKIENLQDLTVFVYLSLFIFFKLIFVIQSILLLTATVGFSENW